METNNSLDRFLQTATKVDRIELDVATHEVQCEERWKTCFQRLGDLESGLTRIESRMTVMGGTTIMFLAGVLVTLITQGGH
jgi:hypothetical protein